MESVGEKQDFESVLTRNGMRHEDFMLRVKRTVAAGDDDAWCHDYVVTVVAIEPDVRRSYVGGPRRDWVAQFATDAAHGVFGQQPTADRETVTSVPPRDDSRDASPFQCRAY